MPGQRGRIGSFRIFVQYTIGREVKNVLFQVGTIEDGAEINPACGRAALRESKLTRQYQRYEKPEKMDRFHGVR